MLQKTLSSSSPTLHNNKLARFTIYKAWNRIHNTSISCLLTKKQDKVECYIRVGWKGLPVTNSLAFWAHLEVRSKSSCVKTVTEAYTRGTHYGDKMTGSYTYPDTLHLARDVCVV
jgi:hypothetical protein